jgi:hypothetical protein
VSRRSALSARVKRSWLRTQAWVAAHRPRSRRARVLGHIIGFGAAVLLAVGLVLLTERIFRTGP